MIEHVAIWVSDLEKMRDYYSRFFGAVPNQKYINPVTSFESYFLSFESGARLEIMRRPGIPGNANDTAGLQHLGLIHLAFAVGNQNAVDRKAEELKEYGFPVLRGPRTTGDGYYEFETLDPENNRIEVTEIKTNSH